MSKLIIATNNAGKVREIKAIFAGLYDEICSLKDEGIKADVVEDGTTFEQNAEKKAREISLITDCDVLADDSGLCVDALNGAPGVYSARFAGTGNDDDNNALLIEKLKDVPFEKRTARFVSAISVAREGKVLFTCIGYSDTGLIADKPAGNNGFGYDVVFYHPEYKCTFGELDSETKNMISHRRRALDMVKEKLLENKR